MLETSNLEPESKLEIIKSNPKHPFLFSENEAQKDPVALPNVIQLFSRTATLERADAFVPFCF